MSRGKSREYRSGRRRRQQNEPGCVLAAGTLAVFILFIAYWAIEVVRASYGMLMSAGILW